MEILSDLNPAQRSAVTAPDGPILVLAGPGSGKTRVLTYRIAYLVREAGIEPWHMMAVTFTNKAAREMASRVGLILGGNPQGITLGTFHATCVRLLRRESSSLSKYDSNFLIFDTDDQRRVVAQAIADLNIDTSRFQPVRILNNISNAKNEIVTADKYSAYNYISEVTRRVYQRYQEILIANNAMDFDDLLMNTVLLLDEQPTILERYQRRYEHILVDEFQDTNTVQYELLKRLAAYHGNIFVVGDADQSIYRWRGADFRNIKRFQDHFPNSQLILLEQNYRSTQIILDAAKAVIRQNHDRVDKELFTDRTGGELVKVIEAYNESDEANAVLDIITGLENQGVSPGSCAIMYRTNAQSRVLEEAFVRAGRNYRLVGATRFYNRREIKDLIAYLRVVFSSADSVSFARIINTPTRGIGRKTLELFYAWAAQHHWQPGEALLALAADIDLQHPFSGRAYGALQRFGKKLSDWIELSKQITVGDLLDTILPAIDFRTYLDDGTEVGQDRWANVMELRGVAVEYEDHDLGQFLEQVALVSDVDDLEDSADVPTLLTLHSAKGLEFPVVFIVGLVDGTLPHNRSLTDGEEVAEERRLFYVGLTRAKERVYLSYAFRRTSYGESEVTVPSRFLNDIPLDLVEGGDVRHRRQKTVAKASSWEWPASSPRTPITTSRPRKHLPEPNLRTPGKERARTPILTEAKYKSGQNVHHFKFGDGTVIESKLTGSDEEVSVAFPGLGVKKLVASMAKLEIKD